MKHYFYFFLLAFLALTSCSKDDDLPNTEEKTNTTETTEKTVKTNPVSLDTQYVDTFASVAMETYYLWIDEAGMLDKIHQKLYTKICHDPITAVSECLYSEDRWSYLFSNSSDFTSSVEGEGLSNGMDVALGQIGSNTGKYFLVVTLVYPDSPAAKAGVKRGDVFITYNGEDITSSNYVAAYYGTTAGTYGLAHVVQENGSNYIKDDNKSVELVPVEYVKDPVFCKKVFDVEGKKVGYLAYTSFGLNSLSTLIDACRYFKEEGVTELVLDLRYNGGGYVITENALASMLAPQSVVQAKEVYEKEVYNALLTQYWGEEVTNFSTDFSFTDDSGNAVSYSTADANIGLTKIYALVSSNTASASEAVIVGLLPYMDIQIIGTQTHGKFCTGALLESDDIFKNPPSAMDGWGFYLMIGTYSDKNGNNPCRPNGLTPDVAVSDNPFEQLDLGDENETMLKAALQQAGKAYSTTRAVSPFSGIKTKALHNATFGTRIMKDLPKFLR